MTVNGIINLDKPKGRTSFAMVALIRKLSGERRVGHAGTLDPEATGVLPICLGKGTRLAEFLLEGEKIYSAEIEFGISTDSYDAAGNIVSQDDPSSLTREQIDTALASFQGSIKQLPPLYSAVKHQGKPLYHWARAGVDVPIITRNVEFKDFEVLNWTCPVLTLKIVCSKGTYIRSLAHDLGQVVGCGAHLRNLVRLKSGPFSIEDSVSVSHIKDAFQCGTWSHIVQPIDTAVLHLAPVVIDDEKERLILNGCSIELEEGDYPTTQWRRAYSQSGSFLALLCYDEKLRQWHPKKVLTGVHT